MSEEDIMNHYHFHSCWLGSAKKPALASYAVEFSHHWHWDPERRVRNLDSIATRYPVAAAFAAAAVPISVLGARLDSSVRGMPPALVSSLDLCPAD